MALRLQFEPTETEVNPIQQDEVALFQTQLPPAGVHWPTFFVSAGLHALVVLVVIPLAEILIPPDEPVWNIQSWGVASVLIRMPEEKPLVAPQPLRADANASVAPPAAGDRGTLAGAASAQASGSGASTPAAKTIASSHPVQQASAKQRAPRHAARPFELPVLPKPVPSQLTLIQPQFLTNLGPQPPIRLPQMIFWAAQRLTAPPRKAFVAPGRQEVRRALPNLDAPPRLDLPNREKATSDLKIAARLAEQLPALPRPAATTMPIRVFAPPTRTATGSVAVDVTPGDPTNLIALSSNPAPAGLNDILAISAASQGGGALPPGPAGGELNRGSVSNRAPVESQVAGSGTRAQGRAPLMTGDGTRAGASSAAGPAGRAGSNSGAAGVGPGQSSVIGEANTSQTGSIQIAAALPSAPPGLPSIARPAVPTRIVHPVNGVFDIVIQTSSVDAVPDATGALAGKPIYTVYLQVGTPRMWIMQYCLPKTVEQKPVQQAGVVYLGNPAPVRAPYPLVTITPALEWSEDAGYVMIRGLLDTKGKFRDLEMWRGATKVLVEAIIDALAKWDFRPATQDGRPVAIQVLLVIPPGNV